MCIFGRVPQILEREKNSNAKLKIPRGGHFISIKIHMAQQREIVDTFSCGEGQVADDVGKQNNTTVANIIKHMQLRTPLLPAALFHAQLSLSLSPSICSASQVFTFSFTSFFIYFCFHFTFFYCLSLLRFLVGFAVNFEFCFEILLGYFRDGLCFTIIQLVFCGYCYAYITVLYANFSIC